MASNPYQVIGGPKWIYSDGYDIDAKPDGEVSTARMWLMLQTLLAERFQLSLHRETRKSPFYLLTAANGTFDPPSAKDDGCVVVPPGPPPTPWTFPCGRVGINVAPSGLEMRGRKASMSQFVLMLAMVMGRPVIDNTGFAGELDLDLRFAPDPMIEGLNGGGTASSGSADPSQPNIMSALEKQLGLKLTASQGPVEVLVIDHAERPMSN